MSLHESPESHLQTRSAVEEPFPRRPFRRFRPLLIAFLLLLILIPAAVLYARHWVRAAVHDSLPQLDGSLTLPGLTAPVTVERDAHGVPHIRAASVDDLVFAQGFVTAQDRLFQMDLLRRHAAGELAEIFGPSALAHDRLQRTLQIRASADRAAARLPVAQRHLLERYAAGVNASVTQLTAAPSPHLPIEFRVLRYTPALWTPRDSILVSLAMFQDLTNAFPAKLSRESLLSHFPTTLTPAERAQFEQDLYPVGSWRDHPPATPIPDLTLEGNPIPDVPLDESQSKIRLPNSGATDVTDYLPISTYHCPSCTPGSNNWAVSGSHTASGKPLLSNDMHLALTLPGIWYAADLEASSSQTDHQTDYQTDSPGEPFHAAGVTIPGLPLIVVGHNDHIAWGFTNLGADVQDIYIETIRGSGRTQEFQASDGSWQPVVHIAEHISVQHAFGVKIDEVNLDVTATRHGDTLTPILDPTQIPALVPAAPRLNGALRTLSLRWTVYDPGALQIPTLEVDSARDWPSFLAAFRNFGGPAQNVVYADDRGHIGFHAVGFIPLRGPASAVRTGNAENLPPDIAAPTASSPLDIPALPTPPAASTPLLSGPLSTVPVIPTPIHEWSGYIPFDQLPQIFDPPSGVIATANSRTAPDGYPYPITLNWASAYRIDRIYHVLAHSHGLTPAGMLALQNDIDSDFDRVLAQRLTYALDHSLVHPPAAYTPAQLKTLHQAAGLLRAFNGRMSADSAAPSILASTQSVLWPMLLLPKLHASGTSGDLNALYSWGERTYALEQILTHTPVRWLPPTYPDWNAFLTSAVLRGLTQAKAPVDLASWRYGSIHVVDIESPVFAQSALLRFLYGHPTGTSPHPQSGDGTTVKQVGAGFGPSERFTADLAALDRSTLNLVLGQSGNPESPFFLDQFPAWLSGGTFLQSAPTAHTLTLAPWHPSS